MTVTRLEVFAPSRAVLALADAKSDVVSSTEAANVKVN